jgi:LmbE family N-acetylglucosaminyl deacetylase
MERDIPKLEPKVVLCVAAHPDDLEFGASGSVARWVKDGAEVHYLICTDASKGSDDVNITSTELITIRREEQRAACKILGVKTVTFLDYEDGVTQPSNELKRDIAREIRRIKPDTVVTMDPKQLYDASFGYVNHNDHRNVGLCAMDAVYPLARDHLSFPELLAEGFEPHKVADLLFMGTFSDLNCYVDITETYDIKLKALGAHASQINMEEPPPWLDEMSRQLGKQGGFDRAEGFIRLNLFV